jgi:hypothetical protein
MSSFFNNIYILSLSLLKMSSAIVLLLKQFLGFGNVTKTPGTNKPGAGSRLGRTLDRSGAAASVAAPDGSLPPGYFVSVSGFFINLRTTGLTQLIIFPDFNYT